MSPLKGCLILSHDFYFWARAIQPFWYFPSLIFGNLLYKNWINLSNFRENPRRWFPNLPVLLRRPISSCLPVGWSGRSWSCSVGTPGTQPLPVVSGGRSSQWTASSWRRRSRWGIGWFRPVCLGLRWVGVGAAWRSSRWRPREERVFVNGSSWRYFCSGIESTSTRLISGNRL